MKDQYKRPIQIARTLSAIVLLAIFILPHIPLTHAQKVTSNTCRTLVGSPTLEPGQTLEQLNASLGCASAGNGEAPAGPCQAAPPPPGDIRAAIISRWGITLNITQSQLSWAWQEFHEIDCTGFLQDIRGTLVDSWENGYAQQFSCPGGNGEYGPTDIMFSSQWNGEFMQAILVHELTHVWQFCSQRGEANLLQIPSAYNGEGGLTKYSRRECPNFAPGFDRIYHEDQADTIALYLNPDSGELTCGNGAPNPFAGGRHSLHRGVAQRGLGR